MISDERSKQAYERLEIPKIYHPFIIGPHNENIRLFTEGSGVKVNIPPLSVMKDEISIAGEKDGVLKVKNAINQVRASYLSLLSELCHTTLPLLLGVTLLNLVKI